MRGHVRAVDAGKEPTFALAARHGSNAAHGIAMRPVREHAATFAFQVLLPLVKCAGLRRSPANRGASASHEADRQPWLGAGLLSRPHGIVVCIVADRNAQLTVTDRAA